MRIGFNAKEGGDFPVIGTLAEDGSLSGFATYGTFRAFPDRWLDVELYQLLLQEAPQLPADTAHGT